MRKLFVGLFAILAIFTGCDDDSDCVNCTGNGGSPTLQNIWPNPDSASWVYDHTMTAWDAEPSYILSPAPYRAIPSRAGTKFSPTSSPTSRRRRRRRRRGP